MCPRINSLKPKHIRNLSNARVEWTKLTVTGPGPYVFINKKPGMLLDICPFALAMMVNRSLGRILMLTTNKESLLNGGS